MRTDRRQLVLYRCRRASGTQHSRRPEPMAGLGCMRVRRPGLGHMHRESSSMHTRRATDEYCSAWCLPSGLRSLWFIGSLFVRLGNVGSSDAKLAKFDCESRACSRGATYSGPRGKSVLRYVSSRFSTRRRRHRRLYNSMQGAHGFQARLLKRLSDGVHQNDST